MPAIGHDARARRRTILAGIAGNVMEWYDFSVYGCFAAVIGGQFSPAKDPASSLFAAFGVFAAGFLVRPIGSLVFGHVGDKLGRKSALTASVLMMAVPTFLVGLLPTWREIGVAASAILGGLTPMAAVYAIERTRDDLSPAFLLMAAAAISLAVIAGRPESYRWVLPGTADRQGAAA
jgi:MFS family permease